MPTPPEVEEFLKREYGHFDPPVTAAAIHRITEDLNLQAQYRGVPVACFRTADDILAVLACDEAEIRALLWGIPSTERCGVLILDT